MLLMYNLIDKSIKLIRNDKCTLNTIINQGNYVEIENMCFHLFTVVLQI